MIYKRPHFDILIKRLQEPRRFLQILSGARQTGKTTLIQQVLEEIDVPSLYNSSDAIPASSKTWIEQQWEIARIRYRTEGKKSFILVIDEIQKINGWSETVKLLWDQDTYEKNDIKVVLLGSSPLLFQKGLTETLAGRFELLRLPHWSYTEMKDTFGFNLEQYIYFGGYPGSASLIKEESRWKKYISEALIETTISKDVLMMTRIDKPALLKRLFELGCLYSGQILSFSKMLGQLTDAGNTTTLSHYLDVLSGVSMLAGIQKYSAKNVRIRSSSPKFMVFNNALITAQSGVPFLELQLKREEWGRYVESAVGAHLLNTAQNTGMNICYWRERNFEVDFVITMGNRILALEVKSGKTKTDVPGIGEFKKHYPSSKHLLVGSGGISLENFLSLNPEDFF